MEYPDQAVVSLVDCLYEGAEASQYARSDKENTFVETLNGLTDGVVA